MNKYIQLLRDHLASQPMEFHDWDAENMLEFLFCCYTEDHPLDSDAVHKCYEKLEPSLMDYPMRLPISFSVILRNYVIHMSRLRL